MHRGATAEPHYHRRITEISLIARGEAEAVVDNETDRLGPGDVLADTLFRAIATVDVVEHRQPSDLA